MSRCTDFESRVRKEGWGDEGSGVTMRGSFDSVSQPRHSCCCCYCACSATVESCPNKPAVRLAGVCVFCPGSAEVLWLVCAGCGATSLQVKTYSRVPGFLQQYTATTRAHARIRT